MNHHASQFLPSHRKDDIFKDWEGLVIVLALAIFGLLLVDAEVGGSRLLADVTIPADAPLVVNHADSRGPLIPAAETVRSTVQDSNTLPVDTF
mgnify:FL=1